MSRAWQSPLPYPGSKREAVYQLSPLVPGEINRVVSPFFGGGSFELYLLASRGDISIDGSDGFSPVINFWRCAIEKTDALMRAVLACGDVSFETLWEWYQDLEARELSGDIGGVRDAARYFVITQMAFNKEVPRGPTRVTFESSRFDVISAGERLLRFGRRKALSRLSLACQDAFQVLDRERDAFLFLDPPYLNDENLYGFSSGRWHRDFSHDRLAAALSSHSGGFLLTYNDTAAVRDLYQWALVEEITFPYSAARGTGRTGGVIWGREVVIRPPGSPSIEEIKKARPPAVRWEPWPKDFL